MRYSFLTLAALCGFALAGPLSIPVLDQKCIDCATKCLAAKPVDPGDPDTCLDTCGKGVSDSQAWSLAK